MYFWPVCFCSWLGIDSVLHEEIQGRRSHLQHLSSWTLLLKKHLSLSHFWGGFYYISFQLVPQLIWQSLLTFYSVPSRAGNQSNKQHLRYRSLSVYGAKLHLKNYWGILSHCRSGFCFFFLFSCLSLITFSVLPSAFRLLSSPRHMFTHHFADFWGIEFITQ